MEKNKPRGRPKKPQQGDLLKALAKRRALDKRAMYLIDRLDGIIGSKRGKVYWADIKYIMKGDRKRMIDLKKYGLDWYDPIFTELRVQCKKPPTIGIIALTELETLDGVLPSGGPVESALLKGMESTVASCIYYNPQYVDKVLTNYKQYDIISAYPYILKTYPMPTTLYKTVIGKVVEEGKVSVFADEHGNATFDPLCLDFVITKTYLYNTAMLGEKFVDKWIKLKQTDKYKKLSKDILNCAIGAIHRYRRNLIARYVWFLQKTRMESVKEYINTHGGMVVKIHTDGIGYIGNCEMIQTGCRLGDFKEEHTNKRILIISAGQYHIEGKAPTLSGISWNGRFVETQEGQRIYKDIFPCIHRGMVIKSYEKDGIEYKELGKEIKFVKGGE